MDFSHVLARSGLSKIELAALYSVSRQTIHAWARGEPPRVNSHTARMAESITVALLNAVSRGLLPMGPMDRVARQTRVARMKQTLQKLSPAPSR